VALAPKKRSRDLKKSSGTQRLPLPQNSFALDDRFVRAAATMVQTYA
jgi:hypothetical protein